ncbi:MAG: xanthine dehydrogenase family protein molybdopterin-binding subunit [Candidatus Aureabacteria bacterium]|nr:xanthine dehydrogenase family protein molybdopterin-binding subunit [Candidatus Auribacterota bacterium]
MIVGKYKYVGKRITRIDARPKVDGSLKYPSDLYENGMVWGRVLRAKYPHAKIRSIDTAEALRLPGVVTVLTHKDIRGINRFGIERQDQPVLAEDRVRYVGDAVALVGAETKEIAEEALDLIKVDYEPLPLLTDPRDALKDNAIKLHDGGNIVHELHFTRGDTARGFEGADVVVEHTYRMQMMDHAFLETEAGFASVDRDGVLTIQSCGQYAFRDQTQIARALNYPQEKIRMIEPYTGGAFGGKDEITVQILLALLALKTGRPCKIWFSREEHFISCTHRHPVEIRMKTAARKDGTLVAHEVWALQDGGAYATLSGPVLCLVVEHCCGPYLIPNLRVDGWAVYTNNGMSGAFRGFGATQAHVAMESQMNIIAEKLGMDPLQLRLKNAIRRGDTFGIGQEMVLAFGFDASLERALAHPVWRDREKIRRALDDGTVKNRWKRRGIGVACSIQGSGLGKGLPDYAATTIELNRDGTVNLYQGTIEIGQGSYTGITQVAAEILDLPMEKIHFIGADTGRTLDSGTTTASRVMYAAGQATLLAARNFVAKIKDVAAEKLGVTAGTLLNGDGAVRTGDGKGALTYAEIARAAKEPVRAEGVFNIPVADREFSMGLPHLYEQNILENGYFKNTGLSTYIVPSSWEAPEIETCPVEIPDETGPFGARSVAEVVTTPTAPAILNAIYDAIGVRFTELPVTPEKIIAALEKIK